MSDNQDLVCVYTATNPAMAELMRNVLEEEGIQAAVADTHQPFPGLPIAPSEVLVQRSSEVAARAIIAAAELAHREAAAADDADEDSTINPEDSEA